MKTEVNWIAFKSKPNQSKTTCSKWKPNQIQIQSKNLSKSIETDTKKETNPNRNQIKSKQNQTQIKSKAMQVGSEPNQVHIQKPDHFIIETKSHPNRTNTKSNKETISWIKTKSIQNKIKVNQRESEEIKGKQRTAKWNQRETREIKGTQKKSRKT